MRTKELMTVAIATMLLIGGAAAVGAASPADQAAENATDAYEENSPDETDETAQDDGMDETAQDDGANESEAPEGRASGADKRAGNADGVGPSDGLPEQVPDHVSEIHETIESFLTGSTDNLGESLSDLLSSGEVADETPRENSNENASQGI